jgi:hypothetical protein
MPANNRASASQDPEVSKSLNGLTAKEVAERLNQPFDPADIKWKPQTVDYKKKTALAVAHADPRAYIDRLNEVLGTDGWTKRVHHVVSYDAPKFVKGKAAYKERPATEDKVVEGCKLGMVIEVEVFGIGSHTSSGESDGADENAFTSAEAQAFKRACMEFGLGRYLYDLPKQTVGYEDFKFTQEPELPDWAIPKVTCDDCGKVIETSTFGGKEYSVTQLVNNSRKKYNGAKLCMEDQRKRAETSKAAAGGRLGSATA